MTTAGDADRRSSALGARGRASGGGGVDRLAAVAESSTRRRTAIVGFLLGSLVTIAVALMIAQNTGDVAVGWLTLEGNVPLWSVILGSFVAGLLVAPALYAGFKVAAHRRRERLALIERSRS